MARMLTIRLSDSIEERLTKLAKRTGRTKTSCAREAILRYIEDSEDAYDAERARERIRTGKEHTIPLGDVMKRYGMKC